MSDTGGRWIGGWTFHASTVTAYQVADPGVIYRCDVTAGGFTVDAPSPAVVNATFGVLLTGTDSGNVLTLNGGAVTINPIDQSPATTVAITDDGSQTLLLFAYDGTQWRLYDGIVSRQSDDPELTTSTTVSGFDDLFEVDATSSDIIVTLPTAPGNRRTYMFKRVDDSAYSVTVDGNGKTIDGQDDQILLNHDCLTIRYSPNQTEWIVL